MEVKPAWKTVLFEPDSTLPAPESTRPLKWRLLFRPQVYSNIRKFKDDLAVFPPDHLVCVPLVLDSLYNRVMGRLRAAGAFKAAVVAALMAASVAHVRARRVVDGVALQYATRARPVWALLGAWLLATVLQPIHMLASKVGVGAFGRG